MNTTQNTRKALEHTAGNGAHPFKGGAENWSQNRRAALQLFWALADANEAQELLRLWYAISEDTQMDEGNTQTLHSILEQCLTELGYEKR